MAKGTTPRKAVSEKSSKKRGRPRLIEDDFRMFTVGASPAGCTERTQQNTYYQLIATVALKDDMETFGYLLAGPGAKNTGQHQHGGVRKTIMVELGRFINQDTIRHLAREICEKRMKALQAVPLLRRIRNKMRGRPVEKPGDRSELVARLLSTITAYEQMHDITVEEIADAIRLTAIFVEEADTEDT